MSNKRRQNHPDQSQSARSTNGIRSLEKSYSGLERWRDFERLVLTFDEADGPLLSPLVVLLVDLVDDDLLNLSGGSGGRLLAEDFEAEEDGLLSLIEDLVEGRGLTLLAPLADTHRGAASDRRRGIGFDDVGVRLNDSSEEDDAKSGADSARKRRPDLFYSFTQSA